jgi:hypothetical protein
VVDALPVEQSQVAAASPEALSQQEQIIDDLARNLDQRRRECRALMEQERELRQAVRRLTRRLKLWEMCCSPGGAALLCSSGLAVSLLLGVCAGGLVRAAFGVLVGFVSACLTVPVPLLVYLNRDWGEGWATGLRARLDEAQRELPRATAGVTQAEQSVCVAQQDWERAEDQYERMHEAYQRACSQERARQRRERLLRTNWRALRDTPFEDFLQQVFEALGYSVQTTKASGDQGLDLILTGKGRRIGVQAKGYTDNVGNHAVMEAHAGTDYYRCDCCVVITNSDFTRQARELAARIGCRLISGSEIPDLILGRIYL